MGCDIHAHLEAKEEHGARVYWISLAELDIWRSYVLFAKLAGVRNSYGLTPIAEPRGLPDDVSLRTKLDADEWGTDGHSHSWVTLAEIEKADWTHEGEPICPAFREGVLPYIRYHAGKERASENIRVVFWFDN